MRCFTDIAAQFDTDLAVYPINIRIQDGSFADLEQVQRALPSWRDKFAQVPPSQLAKDILAALRERNERVISVTVIHRVLKYTAEA